MSGKIKTAIIGSGNIGTDLMTKIKRHSELVDVALDMAGAENAHG